MTSPGTASGPAGEGRPDGDDRHGDTPGDTPGQKHLWLDPGFGASGDMLLGALLGLGPVLEAVRADVASLGVDGWSLTLEPVQRAGISATRAVVTTIDTAHHRPWSTIDALLAGAGLPEPVSRGARATFARLAEVEATIHDVTVDEVHFHEVGAIDAIVDIVGVWSARHHLGAATVASGPVGVGNGVVAAAHGQLPAPAPATVALLTGALIRPVASPWETVTPTGAALLATLVDRWGPVPAGQLTGWSRGAGGRNPDTHPNIVGALLVTAAEPDLHHPPHPAAPGPARTQTAVVLATNLDDATPEVIGHTLTRLLEAGADDAWVIPIGMKKHRPGHELRVLCHPSLTSQLEAIVFAETGTLGLRRQLVDKQVLDRRWVTVTVHGTPVRIKVGPHGAKPEHDDLAALSRQQGRPLRALAEEALDAYRQREQ